MIPAILWKADGTPVGRLRVPGDENGAIEVVVYGGAAFVRDVFQDYMINGVLHRGYKRRVALFTEKLDVVAGAPRTKQAPVDVREFVKTLGGIDAV
jgi:hypothetical protein